MRISIGDFVLTVEDVTFPIKAPYLVVSNKRNRKLGVVRLDELKIALELLERVHELRGS